MQNRSSSSDGHELILKASQIYTKCRTYTDRGRIYGGSPPDSLIEAISNGNIKQIASVLTQTMESDPEREFESKFIRDKLFMIHNTLHRSYSSDIWHRRLELTNERSIGMSYKVGENPELQFFDEPDLCLATYGGSIQAPIRSVEFQLGLHQNADGVFHIGDLQNCSHLGTLNFRDGTYDLIHGVISWTSRSNLLLICKSTCQIRAIAVIAPKTAPRQNAYVDLLYIDELEISF